MDHQAKPSSTMNTVKKIFIQRDYSQGTNIRFDTTFPKEFRDDKDNKDKDFKNKVNSHYFSFILHSIYILFILSRLILKHIQILSLH